MHISRNFREKGKTRNKTITLRRCYPTSDKCSLHGSNQHTQNDPVSHMVVHFLVPLLVLVAMVVLVPVAATETRAAELLIAPA